MRYAFVASRSEICAIAKQVSDCHGMPFFKMCISEKCFKLAPCKFCHIEGSRLQYVLWGGGGGAEAPSESPRCNDMVAEHFPRFFGTAIKCEIARRFPRSVVKVGLHVQCKNISISSGVQP